MFASGHTTPLRRTMLAVLHSFYHAVTSGTCESCHAPPVPQPVTMVKQHFFDGIIMFCFRRNPSIAAAKVRISERRSKKKKKNFFLVSSEREYLRRSQRYALASAASLLVRRISEKSAKQKTKFFALDWAGSDEAFYHV